MNSYDAILIALTASPVESSYLFKANNTGN